jgi:S-adenosylmethionine synthetase
VSPYWPIAVHRAGPGPEALAIEVVERKGLGHPDSICDSLAEAFGVSLARAYMSHYGQVLHYNVDKVLLRAGSSRPEFGGGQILAPMEIYLAGRASAGRHGEINIADLAQHSALSWLKENLRSLEPERHVRVHCLVRPGAPELVELFGREGKTPCSNDTSIGVGFAPLSDLERAVLVVERALTSVHARARFKFIGEDVKVMGLRQGGDIRLTVACAMIGRALPDSHAYEQARQTVASLAIAAAYQAIGRPVEVLVNRADAPEKQSYYLTVTGTSAESGDDGQAGRGNRANGLITPYRPMTIESFAGKNAVNHVGKLYSLAADRMAATLLREIPSVKRAEVVLVSAIGRPITEPELADVALGLDGGDDPSQVHSAVVAVVTRELARLPDYWRDAIKAGSAVATV